MCGSRSSLGIGPRRPGVDVVHGDPRRQRRRARAAPGRRGACGRRPRRRAGPARVASAATWTFWPPASTPPRTASGLACSDTMAILIGVHLLQQVVPVGEEAVEAEALERGRAGGLARLRAPRPGRATRRRSASASTSTRVETTPAPARDGVGHLGRARARRPASRGAWPRAARARARSSGSGAGRRAVAPSRAWSAVLGQVVDRGDGRRRRARASMPKRSIGAAVAQAGEQVGAGHAAAARGLVDHDRRARELAGVAVAGVDDAVLDHPRRRRPGVPEEAR